MSKINSKRKGKNGELGFVNLCKKHGWDKARRSVQFNGQHEEGQPDIYLPYLWTEVKRVEKLNLSKAMAQAKAECGDKIPIVAHRKNHEKWLVTIDAEKFLEMYGEWYSGEVMKGDKDV